MECEKCEIREVLDGKRLCGICFEAQKDSIMKKKDWENR